ncbi:DsbE family thiol:disulfide interchange protein [Parasphingorhabdus cellanae]|uniref:DsbE family thiol:disulfide interchange protein n=1 Tax=Parasphingorhabdus cellanae TaxID=2806553 RepID=A0ABX7T308_9SPHN|nr:DsbE family thiol:disulfide interchange protein [Parasphingorhabdus cellanae]QTD55943.1 DsbE family thiol:disulfide interchange protein [Parasphingorhabdus cellanae]
MNRWLLWVPLVVFGIFFAVVAAGLIRPKDNIIESKMIGKPIPEFSLPAAVEQRPALSVADLATGKPQLLNIFASWCVPCIAEAPQLLELERAGVQINGIASRDTPQDIANFLNRWGNPYVRIGTDVRSVVQLELGSSGVPETFVIDGNGIIVHQHVGDIRKEDVPELLEILENAG